MYRPQAEGTYRPSTPNPAGRRLSPQPAASSVPGVERDNRGEALYPQGPNVAVALAQMAQHRYPPQGSMSQLGFGFSEWSGEASQGEVPHAAPVGKHLMLCNQPHCNLSLQAHKVSQSHHSNLSLHTHARPCSPASVGPYRPSNRITQHQTSHRGRSPCNPKSRPSPRFRGSS